MSAMPSSDAPVLLREDRGRVATLTLNRPQRINLLTGEMLDALQRAFDALAGEPDIRVVVLAGAGKGFCAGHDVRELRAFDDRKRIDELFARCGRMMQSIAALPQPVIARVQGVAAAAGCQLVAQCDLAVASEAATFTTPGVTWGYFCATPAVALGRNVSRKRALEMLLTGETIDAATARDWGLVNRVVPENELDAAIETLSRTIADKPRDTVAAGKRAFYAQLDLGLGDAYSLSADVIACSFASDKGREGMDAFIAKKEPPH